MLPREHYLKQPFQDVVNFPDGFEKGGLSDIQARLVRKNGVLISALIDEEVSDPTTDDLHILKVIANQSAPKSPVEQAWIKYLAVIKAKNLSAKPAKKAAKTKGETSGDAPEAAKPKKATRKTSEKA